MTVSWQENAVIYGIDIARFYSSSDDSNGDIKGVVDKLDYLVSLGVTALWILPFYTSPRRDNGYDVADYMGVDERFGTIDDVKSLVKEAHRRNIKIIIDLIVHHTSDRHPWFRGAVEDPSSKYHDYYIWDDKPIQKPPSANNFPEDEPAGVWRYEDKVGKFYHHRFYHFQPDINIANPDVQSEIEEIMSFWLDVGVDGFRIDAATHLFEPKGKVRVALDSKYYLKKFREYAKGALLVAEADVKPKDFDNYTGDEGFDMVFNFLMNNSLFLALAREDPQPIVARLKQLESVKLPSSFLNFARNFDEIDLEQLTDDERNEVMEKFAPKESMRLYGRGIRRQLSTMVNNQQQLKLVYSLLFSLPGSTMLTNGSELMIEDDLSKPDRKSVRLPMPWDRAEEPSRNLIDFFGNLIKLRKQFPSMGKNLPRVSIEGSSILVTEYDEVTTIHNLSQEPQLVPVITSEECLFGEIDGDKLIGYGYCWLKNRGKS